MQDGPLMIGDGRGFDLHCLARVSFLSACLCVRVRARESEYIHAYVMYHNTICIIISALLRYVCGCFYVFVGGWVCVSVCVSVCVWCLCLFVCVCEHQVRCVTTYALWKNTNGGCLFPIQENDSGVWEVGSGERTEDERGESLFWLSSASPVRHRHAPHPSSSSLHTHTHTHTNTHTHTHKIYMHTIYIHIPIYVYIGNIYIHRHNIYIYQYMYILVTCMYIYIYVYLHPSSILLITIQQISIHEKIKKQSFA
jgi:hypothetical protein